MKHPFRDTRRLALRKLGQLFAALDRAVNGGELEQAKGLLAEVRDTLTEARQHERGAASMRLDPASPRAQKDAPPRSGQDAPSPRSRHDLSGIRRLPTPEVSALDPRQRARRRIPG
jgi:hypothetical protein